MTAARAPRPVVALLQSGAVGLLARLLLCLPYMWSGVAKLADLGGALAEVRALGLAPAGPIVAAVVAVQLCGSALVVSGRQVWLGAGALGVFTLLATLLAHGFWTETDPGLRAHALNTFLEHLALIGGFLLAAVLLDGRRGEAAA